VRPRSRYGRLLGLALALALAGACGNGSAEEPVPPPSRAEGLITEITPSAGEPEIFVLETRGDGSLEVLIAEDVDYGFDLEHLREHMDEDLPVIVELEERDGKTYATTIEDA